VAKVRGLGPGSAAVWPVIHSSYEPGVRCPCSDFMDMLRCLINC